MKASHTQNFHKFTAQNSQWLPTSVDTGKGLAWLSTSKQMSRRGDTLFFGTCILTPSFLLPHPGSCTHFGMQSCMPAWAPIMLCHEIEQNPLLLEQETE